MLKELDSIILTTDIDDEGLKAGDVGTIVHMHPGGEAFMVEFMTLDGNTISVIDVLASQARPVTDRDVTHARSVDAAIETAPSR